MRYVSLFSGVEAATVAWSKLGWEPLAFAEVDEFPSAVLAHRFPNVPNIGDVCNIDWKEFHEKHGAVDVLIGGSPCQSFSIAGGREGLQGESRLMFEYIRAVRELVRASGGGSPRYIVWENVPGCLSSNQGRDFGCLLDELEECGYFVAWRTLDSQFARVFRRESGGFAGPVPQRRRRVFLVGSLGGPSAADILFERESMRGDHPKGREAREALARDSEGRAGMGDSAGCLTPWDNESKRVTSADGVFPTLYSSTTSGQQQQSVLTSAQPIVLQSDGSSSNGSQNGCGYNDDGSAYTVNGRDRQSVCIQGSMVGRDDANGPRGGGTTRTFRSPSTQSTGTPSPSPRTSATRSDWRGFDGSMVGALHTGSGKNDHFVMTQYGDVAGTLRARADSSPNVDGGQNVLCMGSQQGRAAVYENLSPTVTSAAGTSGNNQPVVCMESAQAKAVIIQDGSTPTLNASHEQPIVCAADDNGKAAIEEGMCGALKVGGGAP